MKQDKSRIISIACDDSRSDGAFLTGDLALSLAGQGNRVCLIDSARSTDCAGPLSAIKLPGSSGNLVLYDLPLSYTAGVICLGLDFIPQNGSSGLSIPGPECYDFILVNSPARPGRESMSLFLEAELLILVMKPSKSSLIRNYTLLKILKQKGYDRIPGIVLDMGHENIDPERFTNRFSDKCRKHLGLTLSYLGTVPESSTSGIYNKRIQDLFPEFKPAAKNPGPFDFWESSLAGLIQSNIRQIYGHKAFLKPDREHEPDDRDHDFDLEDCQPVQEEIPFFFQDQDDEQQKLHEPLVSDPDENPDFTSGTDRLRIGIICSDESLWSLLEDMFREKGHEPLNMLNGKPEVPDIFICSFDKPEKPYLDALKKNAGIPCIWLSQYKKFSPPWTSGLKFVQVLEKPFSLENVYMAVEKAARKNKTSADFKTALPV